MCLTAVGMSDVAVSGCELVELRVNTGYCDWGTWTVFM